MLIKKFSTGGLVMAMLASQSLFAYQPEKSFWAERRRVARQNPSAMLASLSLGARGGESLAAEFPTPHILGSSLSHSVARSVPRSFLTGHAALLSTFSPVHGTVRKVSLGHTPTRRGPVVIHLQDVHLNTEAQGNIRETVADLLTSGQVSLVALEGATEDIALQPFVEFPNRKAVELTANYLLRENKISGPIHAAMTAQGKLPPIRGIDDPVHYAANVQAYKDSAPKLEGTRRAVKARQMEIEEKKKTVFSPSLLAFDKTVTDYRNEKISLGAFVETLSLSLPMTGLRGGGRVEKATIETFLHALNIERHLDFRQVDAERSKLIEKLTQTLSVQETKELMAQSIAYRTGELRYGDFYALLKETCQKKGIRLSDYPAMDAYIQYVLLSDGIDPDQLLNEIAALEKAAYSQRAITAAEKGLAAQSRHAWLTSKLVEFALIPSEWDEYKATPDAIISDLASFETFYREAEIRDTAMAQNLLTALDQPSTSRPDSSLIALLVTGGFHAEGMAKQLTNKGATVISYVPKIEKVDTTQGSSYLSVFTQEKTPLEKLFQGDKLFLSPDMVTAAKTIAPPLVVGLDSLMKTGSDQPIEKIEELNAFLKDSMGKEVKVSVESIGSDLINNSVNVSIKLGEKETVIQIKTGPHYEILTVNGVKPESPSSLIHHWMIIVGRLHSWLGPAADRVVRFTEAIPLSGLPFWTAAHKAWWFVHHPTINTVSDVVWQLAFLEGAATAIGRVQPKAWGLLRHPFRAIGVQMGLHSAFNAVSPIKAIGTVSSEKRETSSEGPEDLTRKIDELTGRLNSTQGNIDRTGIEMMGSLSQELIQNGSVDQLERFGVLVAPRSFNFSKPMADAAQKVIPLIMSALIKHISPEASTARTHIVSVLSKTPMNKWEEILWELKLVNLLSVTEVEPLIAGIIANTELRKIQSDSQIGKRMEHVAEGIEIEVGELLARMEPTSPLYPKVRLLVKLLPRESALYDAWTLAAQIDDVILDSKFSHKLRERIHGHFSNEDYDLTVAYRYYLETGLLDKIRVIDPFFIPDENDEAAMNSFQAGGDRTVYESFLEMERLLIQIIHHDPSGFENRYHVLKSHKTKTEQVIKSFTEALTEKNTQDVVRIGGVLRHVLREELYLTNDPLSRFQFMLLDEDVERLVYLHLGNYFDHVSRNPVGHIQELSLVLGDLAEQLGAYGLISVNTAELCAHIRGGRDHIYVSQVRDLARILIDNHHQLGYVFLSDYHDIGMAVSNNKALKVDQFIGALMRRRELDLHRAVQAAELLLTATGSLLKEKEDHLLFSVVEPENGNVTPIFFYPKMEPIRNVTPPDARALYGSKGFNLAVMSSVGIPVPEGLNLPASLGKMRKEIGSEAFNYWLGKKLKAWIKMLEANVGEKMRFGNQSHPLLLSVRSGSAISMPGMMSTIPNVGINDAIANGLAKKTGNPWFAFDTYRLFLRDFAVSTWGMNPEEFNDVIPLMKVRENVASKTMLSVKAMKSVVEEYKEIIYRAGHKKELNAVLEDPYLALLMSVNTVLDSWESGPARVYREREGLSHKWGTGVVIQRMRYGNLVGPKGKSSLTGVLFTRDVHSARLGLNGEFVVGSQGNDIVAGTAGYPSIHSIPDDMKIQFPDYFEQLERCAYMADRIFRANQDIEFTIEEGNGRGKMFILQSRDKPYEGEQVRRLDPLDHRPLSMGVGVSGGGFRGVVGFIDSDLKTLEQRVNSINGTIGKARVNGIVLLVNAPGNQEVNTMLEVKGWAVGSGGRTSHAALMAKQHGVNAIFGLDFIVDSINRRVVIKGIEGEKVVQEGEVVSIDGSPHAGGLYRGSVPFKREEWQGEGESHGGVWPWMRVLFIRVGFSGKVYDRAFAWMVENGLSQILLGPLLGGGVGLLSVWFGLPLAFSDTQYAWAGFFLGHFVQQLWGRPAPSRSTLFSAALMGLLGLGFQMNPLSPLGLSMHFVFNALIGSLNRIPTRESKVKSEARADAVKAAALARGGNEMSGEDVRALLLPKIETVGIEHLASGVAFSRSTAQRLRGDFEYRHEFVQAYRKEFTKVGRPLPSLGDVFWSFHQVSTLGRLAAPTSKPDNAIQVIEGIISEKDLDNAKTLIDKVVRANGSGSTVPMKLRLISADPAVRKNLERMARGNPHISAGSVELDATSLATDFERWRVESHLQNVRLRLVISVSEGIKVRGVLGTETLYSRALRAALSELPVRPIDIFNFLEIAMLVGQNA